MEKDDIEKVIEFEIELRRQEPDTYFWEPDETYAKQLEASFDDIKTPRLIQFNDSSADFAA